MLLVLVSFTGNLQFGSLAIYRPPLDRGSGLRAGVSKCITAAAYSALPPALLVMWVVAAEV